MYVGPAPAGTCRANSEPARFAYSGALETNGSKGFLMLLASVSRYIRLFSDATFMLSHPSVVLAVFAFRVRMHDGGNREA